MFRAMHYKEFKQRIRRQLGMKKHRILREHSSILERNTYPSNRRIEKTQVKRETEETQAKTHDTRCVQQNNHVQKVLYITFYNIEIKLNASNFKSVLEIYKKNSMPAILSLKMSQCKFRI